MAKAKNIPVYLFTGFLEAGKTKFAQETLEDSSFNNGDRILLLVCEEGVEEYEPDNFAASTVFTETIEEEEDLTAEHLSELLKKHGCEYVMIEYNGMWMLDSLYSNLPEGWMVAQEFLFIDSSTFEVYNNNMRQLMVDKFKSCELAVFNRFPAGNEELKLLAHKAVRAVNRRCDIAFETPDGKVTYDDIEIPLPYDLDAPVAEVGDNAYAVFYQDIMEKPERYDGKTVRILLRAVNKTRKLRPGYFLAGRDVMACCANDIQFAPLAAECADPAALKNLGWYRVTARVDVREMQDVYGGRGPVLHMLEMTEEEAPEYPVATFY